MVFKLTLVRIIRVFLTECSIKIKAVLLNNESGHGVSTMLATCIKGAIATGVPRKEG
jgi:hypothetical protein